MTALLLLLLLQTDSLSNVMPHIDLPPGFNWWYVAIYAAGMFGHFVVHVVKTGGGWKALTGNFIAQFSGWFLNKKHLTALTGAPGAIIALASQWGLNLGFGTLASIPVAIALGAGYIADSILNNGTPSTQIPPVPQAPPAV